MANGKQDIVNAIETYIQKCSGNYYREYYVGISEDARNRLFNDHKVDEDAGCWIYDTANSHMAARDVEKHFIAKGMKGGGGGGSEKSDMVYVYQITNSTVE
ncbi:hypothetical protein [Rhodohalobacter halophilus]|uniref:hypothetical protein n=1 Tax=Rhodohalobacter halophilus TaxID=1812810 RepID=UPI00083F5168|nr:hypothetical protein [Rhodohalobacter halophilus]